MLGIPPMKFLAQEYFRKFVTLTVKDLPYQNTSFLIDLNSTTAMSEKDAANDPSLPYSPKPM